MVMARGMELNDYTKVQYDHNTNMEGSYVYFLGGYGFLLFSDLLFLHFVVLSKLEINQVYFVMFLRRVNLPKNMTTIKIHLG